MSLLLMVATVSALSQTFAVQLPVGGPVEPPPIVRPQIVRRPIAVDPEAYDWLAKLVEDEQGGGAGAFVVWLHDLQGRGIRVQHLLDRGQVDPLWPRDGIVAHETTTGGLLDAATDGRGGLYLLTDEFPRVFIERIDASGSTLHVGGGPTLLTTTYSEWGGGAAALPDGHGGLFVAWTDGRAGRPDLYVHHVMASGNPDLDWPEGGVAVCRAGGRRGSYALSRSGASLYVAWDDYRNSSLQAPSYPDVYLGRLDAGNGSLDPAWPADGMPVAIGPSWQDVSGLFSDGEGVTIAFNDESADDWHGGLRRFSSSGRPDPHWPEEGIRLSQPPDATVIREAILDGRGGVMLLYDSNLDGVVGGVVQRLRDPRQPRLDWGPSGVSLGRNTGTTSLARDNAGGAFVSWWKSPASELDVRVQHVLGSGQLDPAWSSDGARLPTGPGTRPFTMSVATRHGAIFAWDDGSDLGSLESDVISAYLEDSPIPLPSFAGDQPVRSLVGRAGVALSPEPAQQRTDITFTLQQRGRTSVRVMDVTGRRVRNLDDTVREPGTHRVPWDLRDDSGRQVAPGLYIVVIESGAQTLSRRITVIR